jgi:hypothetical protein
MFSPLLLLIHLALFDVAYSTLDIGPAHVDVDVFMSLDHQTSSTFPATASTATTTTTPEFDTLIEYSETTHSPLHPYSKATSYIGSAWDKLNSALRDSETSTSTTDLNSPATTSMVTATTMPIAYATSRYAESTQSPLHPVSRATSYIGSAWDELNSALHDSETSTLDFASLATSADEATCTDSSIVHSPQSSMIDLPQYSDSTYFTSRKAYDGSLTEGISLFASTTGSASCISSSSWLSSSNVTSTWTWPPIVSAWPSPNTHPGNSTHSSSPIVQSGSAGGKPTIMGWACWVLGALILAVEA